MRGRHGMALRSDDERQLSDSELLDHLGQIGTPVGPVAAGIMVVFVLLVIAMYAYRHQVRDCAFCILFYCFR
jgi:hypothetical protein